MLDSLVENKIFERHQSGTANSKDMIASCVVHFTPEPILRNERYQKWMENFGWSTQHIIVNESNNCLGIEAIHKVQHQLHLLHNEIFPFLDESNIPIKKSTTSQNENINDDDNTEIISKIAVRQTVQYCKYLFKLSNNLISFNKYFKFTFRLQILMTLL